MWLNSSHSLAHSFSEHQWKSCPDEAVPDMVKSWEGTVVGKCRQGRKSYKGSRSAILQAEANMLSRVREGRPADLHALESRYESQGLCRYYWTHRIMSAQARR